MSDSTSTPTSYCRPAPDGGPAPHEDDLREAVRSFRDSEEHATSDLHDRGRRLADLVEDLLEAQPVQISASLEQGDGFKSLVRVKFGDDVQVVVYESLMFPGALRIDVDGDFTERGALINVNDGMAWEALHLP